MLDSFAVRPRIRILIIDDEADVLDVLASTAPAYAFDPSLATSIDGALLLLRDGLEVDLVMCDVSMPDGGAATWLRSISLTHPRLVARTIVMTGWSASGESPLPEVPNDRCLFKPFAMSDVRRLAERLLALS